MEPTAVVFDLDGTLAVTRRDRQTLLNEATEAAGVRRIDRSEYLAAHGRDVASETRAPIFDEILDIDDPDVVADRYREAIAGDLEPVSGVETLLADLRRRYRLGLLTDGPIRAQYSKVDQLGWRDRFDAIIVTGSLPAGKPDHRTFERILEALAVEPADAVYVGDNPEVDIAGAAAAGLATVQVIAADDTPSPDADATVRADAVADDLRALLLS